MDAIGTAKRLGDELYQALTAMIERREIAEGSRLPSETELAARFGVSRPTVRETLARLRDEGRITSRRGSGSYVRPRSTEPAPSQRPAFHHLDSFDQIKQCYEFRMAVEGDAAFLAANARTEADLKAIKLTLSSLDKSIGERLIGAEADLAFHLAIARASGNSWFVAAFEAMQSQIGVAIEIARKLSLHKSDQYVRGIQAEHVAIFEAIAAGNAVRAREAMRDHLARTRNRIFRGSKN
jgi:GntR family transcriptional repressor for pyruvate dehydrogenase complex